MIRQTHEQTKAHVETTYYQIASERILHVITDVHKCYRSPCDFICSMDNYYRDLSFLQPHLPSLYPERVQDTGRSILSARPHPGRHQEAADPHPDEGNHIKGVGIAHTHPDEGNHIRGNAGNSGILMRPTASEVMEVAVTGWAIALPGDEG